MDPALLKPWIEVLVLLGTFIGMCAAAFLFIWRPVYKQFQDFKTTIVTPKECMEREAKLHVFMEGISRTVQDNTHEAKMAIRDLDTKLDRWREYYDKGQDTVMQGLSVVKTDVAVLSTRLDETAASLENFKFGMGQ